MAVHSAAALIVLSSGLLLTRPNVGPVAVLTRQAAGGIAARRLLPPLVVVVVVVAAAVLVGMLTIVGERQK